MTSPNGFVEKGTIQNKANPGNPNINHDEEEDRNFSTI